MVPNTIFGLESGLIEIGRIDRATVIGAAVVFGIIGAAILTVYYVGFVRPAREELEKTRNDALAYVDTTLGTINTDKARTATGEYRSQILAAETKKEIASIQAEAASTYDLEHKRKDLLVWIEDVTKGSYHSLEIAENLKREVREKTSIDLEGYKSAKMPEIRSEWMEYHLNTIEGLPGDTVDLRISNSIAPLESSLIYNIPKENAYSLYVENRTLEDLQKMKFEGGGSYAVPILDTFQRVPTIEPGTTVDVGIYDLASKEIKIFASPATVLNVIYPKDVLSSISWSFTDDDVSHSFSTNVWEQIKAGKAGDADAERSWTDWAKDVVGEARDANIGDYDLHALYVVEIHKQKDALNLTQIEQYMTAELDVILIAHTY